MILAEDEVNLTIIEDKWDFYIKGGDLRKNWVYSTRGTFSKYQGKGIHALMIEDEVVEYNVIIIRNIIEKRWMENDNTFRSN